MRIIDWSSDVCSSDLVGLTRDRGRGHLAHPALDRGGAPGRVRPDHPGQDDRHPGPPLRWPGDLGRLLRLRSEEHTSELQSLMRISYAVFCLKKKKKLQRTKTTIKMTTTPVSERS